MSFKDQVINLIIQGRDLFSSEAKKSEKALGELASQSEILNSRLTELQNQQNSIRRIEELTGAIKKGEQSYLESSVALDKLIAAQKAAAAEAKQLEQSQKSGTAELAKLQAQQAESTGQLARYESQIAQARAEVERLSNSQSLGAASGKEQSAELAKATTELAGLEQAQRETSQAAAQLSSAIDQQENQLRETSVAAERAGQTKAEYALKVKAARGELTQLGSTLNKNQNEYRQHEASLRSAGVSMDKLADASRDLKQQQSAAEIAISGVNEKLVRHERLLEQSSKQAGDFRGSIGSATSSLLVMAGAYIGIDKLFGSLRQVFTTGIQFEKLNVQFTALMGSIEEGNKATDWVKQFAKNTPLQLEEVSQAFVKLKAFGLDPMDGTLQAIVDQSFKLGGSFQEVEGISLALGQAWAKQKLQGEEILQLVERGVPAWDLLANVTGKNTAELQKLSEAGKLGRDVIKQLIDEIAQQSGGAAAANMSLLSGLISNAKDNLSNFYNEVANSGAMDWLKDQLIAINKQFEAMAADGRLQAWAKRVSDFIVAIGESIKSTVTTVLKFREEITFLAQAWLALKVGTFLGSIIDGARLASEKVRALAASTVVLSRETDAAAVSSGRLASALKGAFALVGVDWAIGKFVELKDAIFSLKEAQDKLDVAQKQKLQTDRQVDEQLQSLSKTTGIYFASVKDVLDAEEKGLITYNQKLGMYVKLDDAQKSLNQSNAEQVGQLKLTEQQAKTAADSILSLSDSFVATDGNAESMNRQIRSVIDALRDSNGEYDAYIIQLERLAEKNEEAAKIEELKQSFIADTEEAYKALGITSGKTLQDIANKAQAAFEVISSQEAPLRVHQQAFMKWAEAALAASEATGESVPEILKTTASALGLTDALKNLTAETSDFTASQQSSSQFQAQYISKINETSQSIEKLKATLTSTTASVKEKSAAQQQLTEKQKALKDETEELNKVKLLEAQTYGELVQEYRSTQDELDRLNEMYKRGAIAAYEYIEAKERLEQRLSVVGQLIGDFEKKQRSSGEQVDKSNLSLREQKERMDALANSTGRATRFTSLFAEANNYLRQEFDLAGKSNEELTSRIQVLDQNVQQAGATLDMFWGTLANQYEEGANRERAIIGATLQFRKLTNELDNGTVSLDRLNKISYIANYNLGNLDKASMETLKQSIDAARGRVQALGDELSGTVSNLRRELLQLKGETEKIEAEDFRARNEELTKKLREAEKTGDNTAIAKAREALDLARQIAQEKQKQRIEDERESQAQSAANASAAARVTDAQQPTANRPSILTVSNSPLPPVQNNNSNLPTLLVLQVGTQKFNTSIDRDVLAQLVASIKQQMSVGG